MGDWDEQGWAEGGVSWGGKGCPLAEYLWLRNLLLYNETPVVPLAGILALEINLHVFCSSVLNYKETHGWKESPTIAGEPGAKAELELSPPSPVTRSSGRVTQTH